MKNLTPELIAKAKTAKSAEELFELAKANNVELTEEEAKTYFEQLGANGTVSDDELDIVTGGGEEEGCGTDAEEEETANNVCPHCHQVLLSIHLIDGFCPYCKKSLRERAL